MKSTTSLQDLRINNLTGESIRQQHAQYLSQQPSSIRVQDRWMKRLEAASLGIVAAFFTTALYLSFTWKSINPILIPTAWMIFVASIGLTSALFGLHAIFLRVFPAVILAGKSQQFVTGKDAVWKGGFTLLAGLLTGAFWGVFAYNVAILNWAMLEPLISLLGGAMGIGIVASMLIKTFQKISGMR